MGNSVPARPRRLKALPVLWIGPTRDAARRAARRRRGRAQWDEGPRRFLSLAAFLRGPAREPARIVLCPAGRGLDADLAFLEAASRRALWPGPPWLLHEAVAGFLNLPETSAPGAAPPAHEPQAAVLLEGPVDSRRAARVLASRGPRLWILEDPRQARIPAARLAELTRRGVRFCSLRPVRVEAVAASPALAAAKRRWARLVPPGTRVEILGPATGAGGRVRAPAGRPRRSSRR